MSPNSALPRPEYPRPDLHRGLRPGIDWLNLNGPWQFRFDPDRVGEEAGWHQPGTEPFEGRIVVPFPWESHLAWGTGDRAGNEAWFSPEAWLDPDAVNRDNYRELPRHTVGWYRGEVQVPSHWDQRVILTVGAADWEVRTWVNGREVGGGESGYLPVEMDITDALTGGIDELVLRVSDPQDPTQPIGKQSERWYTPTSGIWQPVWLQPRPRAHISEVLVRPSLADGQARVLVTVEDGDGLAVRADVRASIGADAGGTGGIPVRDGRAEVVLEVPRPIPWTPQRPHMYRLQVHLLDGGTVVDTVHTQFGMRDVDVGPLHEGGPQYIRLNGEAVYLRGALDQNFTPDGVYAFASNAAIRRDFTLARRAGLNFLRLHIKTPDPRYCYWADRTGVLLMCDVPNFASEGYSETARERWERAAWGQIRRDYNHPSIIAWCLFNETWGLGGREYADLPERHQWVRDCWERARDLDPTRLVEDNSACLYDHVVTDINSWHFYINDYQQAREHIEQVVEQTHPGSTFNFAGGNEQGDEPLLNSEYGGISARMGDLDVSWCLRFLTNELRRHEQICGYVYTELTDIEWECNGLYDYDRTPKVFGYDPSLVLGEEFVGLDCPPAWTEEPGADVTVPVFLRPSRRARSLARRTRWWARFTDSRGYERMIVRPTDLPAPSSDESSIALTLPDEPGLVRIDVQADDGHGRPAAWNACFIEVRGDSSQTAVAEDSRVLTLAPGEATVDFEAEVEAAEVEGVVHLLAGRGDGTVQYRFELPDDVDASSAGAATFMVELSGARERAPQTGGECWPSVAAVSVGEREVARVRLPDQFADMRGALSHLHGLQGRYGTLVHVTVREDVLAGCIEEGEVVVSVEAVDSGADRGGLTVYGARAGRYPCDPTLTVECQA